MSFKITAAQREYFRYRGVSAEMERRGLGSSRPELAWARRQEPRESSNASAEVDEATKGAGSEPGDPSDSVAG
jgi:hypothetical protein